MAFEKDIVLKITASAELAAITTAINKLQELQKQALGINIPTGTNSPLGAASQQAGTLTANIKSASNAQSEFGRKAAETAKILEEQGRITKQTLSLSASGNLVTSVTKEAPGGLKLTESSTGAAKLTIDSAKAERESAAIAKAALEERTRIAIAKGDELVRANKARLEQEVLGERQAAQTVSEIANKKTTEQIGIADNLLKEKKSRLAQEALGERQSAQLVSEIANRRTAEQIGIADNLLKEKKARLAQEIQGEKLAAQTVAEIANKKTAEQVGIANNLLKEKKARLAQEALGEKQAAQENARIRREAGVEDLRRNAVNTFGQIASRPGVTVKTQQVFDPATQSLQNQKVVVDANGNSIAKLTENTNKLSASNAALTGEINKSSDSLQNAAGKVLLWTVATGAVFGSIRAARAVVENFKDVELATTALSVVARGFGSNQDEIAQGAKNVTQEVLKLKVAFGSVGGEALAAATTFARLGLSQQDTIAATRTALLASNVAFISASDAANLLASAYQQFQLSAKDIPAILDNLNTLSNTNRVTTNELLQSISRTGSVFAEAGGSIQQLAGITASVSEATSRSGAEIGNALKTITSRLGDAKVQAEVFARTGVQLRNLSGDLKPPVQALGDLVVAFQNLSQAERVQVTTSVAGVRQRNILQAALDTFFAAQANVINQFAEASSAENENKRIVETLASAIKQLQAALERLSVIIGDTGVGAAVKLFVNSLTRVIEGISNLGAAGVLALGFLAAYAAAVTLASLSAGSLVASLGSLTQGFSTVNAVIFKNISANTSLVTSNAIVAGSYNAIAVAASRANAATLIKAGGTGAAVAGAEALAATSGAVAPTTIGAAIGAALTSNVVSVGAFAIGASIAVAAVAGIFAGLDKLAGGRDIIDINNIGSDEQKTVAAGQKATQTAENALKAEQAKAELFSTQAEILSSIETKQLRGVQLSEQDLKLRNSINSSLLKIPSLDPTIRDKALTGSLTSQDLRAESQRSEDELLASAEAVNATFDQRIKDQEEILRLQREQVQNEASSRREVFGVDLAIGGSQGFFEGDKAFKERTDAAAKSVLELKQKIEREKIEFNIRIANEEKFKESKLRVEDFGRILDQLALKKQINLNLDEAFAVGDVEKANVQLASLRAHIAEIESNRDLALLTDADVDVLKRYNDLIAEAQKQQTLLNAEKVKGAIIDQDSFRKSAFQIRERFKLDVAGRLGGAAGTEIESELNKERAILAQKKRSLLELSALQKSLDAQIATASTEADKRKFQGERATVTERVRELPAEILDQEFKVKLQILETDKKIRDERKKQLDLSNQALAGASNEDVAQSRVLATSIREGSFSKLSRPEILSSDVEQRKFFLETAPKLLGITADQLVEGGDRFKLPTSVRDQSILKNQDFDLTLLKAAFDEVQFAAPETFEGTIDNATLVLGNVKLPDLFGQAKTNAPIIGTDVIDAARNATTFGGRLQPEVSGSKIGDFANEDFKTFFSQNSGFTGDQAVVDLIKAAAQTPLANKTFGDLGSNEKEIIQNLANAVEKFSNIAVPTDVKGSDLAQGVQANKVNFNVGVSDLSVPLDKVGDAIRLEMRNTVNSLLEEFHSALVDDLRTARPKFTKAGARSGSR